MEAQALATACGAAFVTGLLGGLHCAGMCGGIVTALSAGQPSRIQGPHKLPRPATPGQVLPLAVNSGSLPLAFNSWRLPLAFNGGRIASYMVAGAIAGAAGSLALMVDGIWPVQQVLYLFANLMLAALGLYLLGVKRFLRRFEQAGALLWKRIAPWMRHWLSANTLPRALGLGALWGWMPCGLVYSMLALALLTGNAWQGALLLLAFGAGTLPNLLLAGALMQWVNRHDAGALLRRAGGMLVLAFGIAGLAHAGANSQPLAAFGTWLCFGAPWP